MLADYSKSLIIAGDFNLHLDDPPDSHAKRFVLDVLDTFGLRQLVHEATHKKGHTLDLLITRSEDSLIIHDRIGHLGIADHYAVHFDLRVQKPRYLLRKK